MSKYDDYRKEEETAIERERIAFEKQQKAWIKVQRQFQPFGNGAPTQPSLAELDQADTEYRATDAEVDRLMAELRDGRRG